VVDPDTVGVTNVVAQTRFVEGRQSAVVDAENCVGDGKWRNMVLFLGSF
jgi:hypothetical protein